MEHHPGQINCFHWAPKDEYLCTVVGERHYQRSLRHLAEVQDERYSNGKPDLTAFLVPEPENPYDRNAVRVQINGLKAGYLIRRR